MRSIRPVLFGAFSVISLALSTPCYANDPAAAQALFDQGKKLLAEGKAAQACPKFAESQRLDPGVGTLLNLAACYEKLGATASAWTSFLEAESVARKDGNAEAAKVAQERAAKLAPKLSRVTVSVSPDASNIPGLEVRRDDVVVGTAQWGVPIPVDPGQHSIHAAAPQYEAWKQDIDVKAGPASLEIVVPALVPAPVVEAPPAPAEPPQAAPPVPGSTPAAPPPSDSAPAPARGGGLSTGRYIAIGAGVLGVAGIAVGSVFGLKSLSKRDEAEKYCDPDTNLCRNDTGVELRQDALNAGNISTIGFIIGGVGLAGAATLWFLSPGESSGTSVGVGPGSLVVRSVF